jgi:polysaccharide export outer membrane protein
MAVGSYSMVAQASLAFAKRMLVFCLFVFAATLQAQAQPAPKAAPAVVLGTGDVVKITVFQSPEMTTETRITEAGTITFPLLGVVPVAGLTTTQAEMRIADELRKGKFLVQPQVNILVVQARSRQVSVLGQVAKPGKYTLEEAGNKLTSVLSQAGGNSGADVVTVMKLRNGKHEKIEVDVVELFIKGDLSRDLEIEHGDIIHVQRPPMFYIYGEAARPNAYRLERKMTIMQALAAAGGLTPRGTERDVKVFRRGADDKIQQLVLGMQEPVLADDVIYIRQSLF